MQIVALELENVKSYEHARFEFTSGVNAIVGHNGAGKSTIIEAIGYALFDALPYTVHEFVREGARSGSIAVTFLSTFDERPYRVERRFGASNAYAVYDDELQGKICEGKADVLSFVRQHTLADPSVDLTRLFNDALGVAQGALTTAFAEIPSKRKPIFDTLLQVDDYSTASDRLREPVRRVREQIVEADRTLAILNTRLEQLPVLEEMIAQRSRELARMEENLTQLEVALAANQEQLQVLEAQKAVVDTLTTQLARQEAMERSLEAQLRRAEASHAEAEAAAAIVASNQADHDAYLQAQQQQETLRTLVQKRQSLLDKRAGEDKDLALATARSTQVEQALGEVAEAESTLQKLADAVAQQTALEERLAGIEQASARLADLDRRVAAADGKRQKLVARHAELVAGRAQACAVEEQGQEINKRLADLRVRLESTREQLTLSGAELATLEQQSDALRTIDAPLCPVCEQPLTAEHRAEMLARNQERLVVLRRQSVELEAVVAASQKEIASLEEERLRLQREWTRLPREAELADVTQTIAEAERDLHGLIAERESNAAQAVGLDELRESLAALKDPRGRTAVAAAQAANRPRLEAQLEAERRRQSAAQQQIADLERQVQALGDLEGALAKNNAALRQYLTAYQAVLTHQQIAASLSRYLAELQEIQGQLDETSTERGELSEKRKVASKELDLARYEQVLLDDRKMREELGSLSASLAILREAQARDEAHVSSLHSDQRTLRVVQQQRHRLVRQEEAIEAVRTVIKQAGPFITQAIVRQVSEAAATTFGELMRDHSRILEWGDDYGITLSTGGATRTFRQLSGGEQMSAALAVRLALVREMSNVNVAFFDEPTANLDSARREALAQQIMTVRGFSQLFVISHDDTFEQATQNLIRVTRHGNTTVLADAAG